MLDNGPSTPAVHRFVGGGHDRFDHRPTAPCGRVVEAADAAASGGLFHSSAGGAWSGVRLAISPRRGSRVSRSSRRSARSAPAARRAAAAVLTAGVQQRFVPEQRHEPRRSADPRGVALPDRPLTRTNSLPTAAARPSVAPPAPARPASSPPCTRIALSANVAGRDHARLTPSQKVPLHGAAAGRTRSCLRTRRSGPAPRSTARRSRNRTSPACKRRAVVSHPASVSVVFGSRASQVGGPRCATTGECGHHWSRARSRRLRFQGELATGRVVRHRPTDASRRRRESCTSCRSYVAAKSAASSSSSSSAERPFLPRRFAEPLVGGDHAPSTSLRVTREPRRERGPLRDRHCVGRDDRRTTARQFFRTIADGSRSSAPSRSRTATS